MSKINVEHIRVLDIDLMTNAKVTVSGDSMILTPLPSDESDYERGMRESMQKIAKSCGKVFAVDVGYEQLPDLVDSLVNPQAEPRTRTEYEKVEYSSAWEAAKDHEERKLELWRKSDLNEVIKGNNWKAIQSPSEAAQYHFDLYLKIEKEIDWREDADSYFLKTKRLGINCTIEEAITRSDYCDEFLELCRVALRANGELE